MKHALIEAISNGVNFDDIGTINKEDYIIIQNFEEDSDTPSFVIHKDKVDDFLKLDLGLQKEIILTAINAYKKGE